MLFFSTWPDRSSLIVDAADLDDAIRISSAVAADDDPPGPPPKVVRPLPPGVFVAEVRIDEDDDEHEVLTVDPLEHVADILYKLEDEQDAAIAQTQPAPALRVVGIGPTRCASEAEDEAGALLSCELDAGHEGEHNSGGSVWTDPEGGA